MFNFGDYYCLAKVPNSCQGKRISIFFWNYLGVPIHRRGAEYTHRGISKNIFI
jgi:hypothetical protein